MDFKIVFGIVVIVIGAIAAAILMPGGRTVDENPKLPWIINVDMDGNSEVFGVTLGKTTLHETEDLLSNQATVSLFRTPEGHIDIEAYFDRIFLSGLKANIVLKLDIDDETKAAMFERGARISQMGSGSKKVELSEDDREQVGMATFHLLTYLPYADLEPDLIASHFDQPEQKLQESDKIEHWLYPRKGLDIAINTDGKEVFQYVLPGEFNQVIAPLEALKEK